MDYRAIRPDEEKVKLLKHAVSQGNWSDVIAWYKVNTPWVSLATINVFIREH